MARKRSTIQYSFAAGEISPALWGRLDLEKYRTGASFMRNFFVDFRGGAANRSGTQIVGPCTNETDDSPVLIPFIFGTGDSYNLLFDDSGMMVIFDGDFVREPSFNISGINQGSPVVVQASGNNFQIGDLVYIQGVTGSVRANGISGVNGRWFRVDAVSDAAVTLEDPYGFPLSSAAWTAYSSGGTIARAIKIGPPTYNEIAGVPKFEIRYVQSGDILTLTHPDMAPHDVRRLSHDSWEIARVSFGERLAPPTITDIEGHGTDNDFPFYLYTYVVTAAKIENSDESAASEPETIRWQAQFDSNDTVLATSRKISWNAVPGATLYRLYKAQVVPEETPSTPPYTFGLIGETSALSYQDLNYEPDYTRSPRVVENPFNNGVIVSASVTDPGFGYINPQVVITDSGAGSGGVINAATGTNGEITGMTVINGGEDYSSPVLTIQEANFISGTGATMAFSGSWTDSGGGVYVPAPGSVTISAGGGGYHVPEILAEVTSCSDTVSPSTNGVAYGIVTNGVLTDFEWLIEPSKSTDSSSCTLAFTITDMVPGWVPDSEAQGVVQLGEQKNPRCAEYFQRRKLYAGGSEPTRFDFTRPDLFSNFDTSYPVQDDDSISGVIVGRQVNEILTVTAMPTGVVAFTSAAAFLLSGGGTNEAITPTNITSLLQVSSGSSPLQPLVLGGDLVYEQARGTGIRNLVYTFQSDSYDGADLSSLSRHLLEERFIRQWTWAEEPNRLVYAVRDDGVLLTMAYFTDVQGGVYGWSHHDTMGRFTSVSAIPEGRRNVPYVVVRRPINGGFRYVVERFVSRLMGANQAAGIPANPELAWFVDSGARYPLTEPDAVLSPGTTYPTGQIVDAQIVAGGSGYTDASLVTITDPNPEATGAEMTVTTTGGAITGVTIVNAGAGYENPTIRVSEGTGAIIDLSVASLQDFETDTAIDATVGDVLRVGGGMGVVTEVASSTEFTCNMTHPILAVLPNTDDLPPVLAEAGEWSLTTPVTVIGGLDHLTGQYVTGVADGSAFAPQIVVDGCITLERAASAITAGVGYTSQLRTVRIDSSLPSSMPKRKNLSSATMRVYNGRGISVGTSFDRLVEVKERRYENYGDPIVLQTGGGTNEPEFDNAPVGYNPLGYADQRLNLGGDWNVDGYICIQQSYPLPATILDVAVDVVVGDDEG